MADDDKFGTLKGYLIIFYLLFICVPFWFISALPYWFSKTIFSKDMVSETSLPSEEKSEKLNIFWSVIVLLFCIPYWIVFPILCIPYWLSKTIFNKDLDFGTRLSYVFLSLPSGLLLFEIVAVCLVFPVCLIITALEDCWPIGVFLLIGVTCCIYQLIKAVASKNKKK